MQFDVLARSANSVLGQLRALRDDRSGTIAITSVDTVIGEERIGPRIGLVQRDTSPAWDVVEAGIRANAAIPPVSTPFWPSPR